MYNSFIITSTFWSLWSQFLLVSNAARYLSRERCVTLIFCASALSNFFHPSKNFDRTLSPVQHVICLVIVWIRSFVVHESFQISSTFWSLWSYHFSRATSYFVSWALFDETTNGCLAVFLCFEIKDGEKRIYRALSHYHAPHGALQATRDLLISSDVPSIIYRVERGQNKKRRKKTYQTGKKIHRNPSSPTTKAAKQ